MTQADLTCDVHIIGGGPAGYTAAIYAARGGEIRRHRGAATN